MFVYVCIKHVLFVLLMRVFFNYSETCKSETGLSQSHCIASFVYGAVSVQTLTLRCYFARAILCGDIVTKQA